MAYLKPNCNKVLLFVITKEFHKWPNANEKIFSNPVKKNSICGFHGQSREKLKWWSTFKKYNEQMVSDIQKFYFCSSSSIHYTLCSLRLCWLWKSKQGVNNCIILWPIQLFKAHYEIRILCAFIYSSGYTVTWFFKNSKLSHS